MNQLTTLAPADQGLNQGQQEAADGFFQFLFGQDKELNISGPGGTGKTHTMGHMIDTIIPRYHDTCKMMGIKPEYDEVAMTATTNKAAEQLAQATGRPTQTLASFLGMKVQDDFKTGRSFLTKTNKWKIHDRKILFVDECSMEDTALYQALHDGTMNCRIVHVGDHCQLAPVMENISPVYRQGMPFYQLTEPMRTKNPHLHAVNQQLRNTVETGIFQPIKIVPGVIDWVNDAEMEREIANHFQNQDHHNRVVAYTNRRVIEFNDHIRSLRRLPDHYTVGEQLVNNTAVHLKTQMLSVEAEVEILNLSDQTQLIPIADDVFLEVRMATIRTSIAEVHTDIPLPVDRDHFAALIKYYQGLKHWERYFYLKGNFPDLRPKDASTVYKAQGSSYDVTFIDLGNISTCNNPDQVARQLYVAFSRSRKRVVLYGNLAEKYGGLIF